jgi:hypothetical protein
MLPQGGGKAKRSLPARPLHERARMKDNAALPLFAMLPATP